jgi:hypothetical protein
MLVDSAYALDSASVNTLMSMGEEGGPRTTWSVSNERMRAQKTWAPSDGAPPLSITKAVELGSTWLRSKHPEIKDFRADNIDLFSWQSLRGSAQGIWYYRIGFSPVVGGQILHGNYESFATVVLFDGFVVEPTITK